MLRRTLFGYTSDSALCPSCVYRHCNNRRCDDCPLQRTHRHLPVCYCTLRHDDYPCVTRCRQYRPAKTDTTLHTTDIRRIITDD